MNLEKCYTFNLYPTPFTVLMYWLPIFSLNFLIWTSIVLSPTIISSPQTFARIASLEKTFSGLENRSANNSNSFLGKVNSLPSHITIYLSLFISRETLSFFITWLTLDLLSKALIRLNKTLGLMGLAI